MLKFKLLFAALGIAAASAGQAQEAQFARFVEQADGAAPAPDSAEISPIALAMLQQLHREIGRCVPTGLRLDQARPMTATRHIVQMIQAGEVRNGWTVYARLEGCAEPRPLRLVVIRPSQGPLVVAPLTYGEAISSPTLLLDARDAAVTAASAMGERLVPGCTAAGQVGIESLRNVSQSADLSPDYYGVRYRGTWREAWTFAVCGRRLEIPVDFVTDGESGATYILRASEARLLD
ncbi:MAG TPA: hypothetical protein VF702_07140 [Allosphingosinicella sp.]|jgi:hypothetical protein